MPRKFTKEMTTKLIRYVTKVDVHFNPFDNRTVSAREVIRQIDCERFRTANPKIQINQNMFYNPKPPTVQVAFVDGSEIKFDSEEYECKEILEEMFEKTLGIDFEYETTNKTLDD